MKNECCKKIIIIKNLRIEMQKEKKKMKETRQYVCLEMYSSEVESCIK